MEQMEEEASISLGTTLPGTSVEGSAATAVVVELARRYIFLMALSAIFPMIDDEEEKDAVVE